MGILWAADTLSVTSPSMRGAWYGLSTAIVAAIQVYANIIILIIFLVYPGFQKIGNQTKVQLEMEYFVKFGLPGVLMDKMMIGKQFNSGINKFLNGLKTYVEK